MSLPATLLGVTEAVLERIEGVHEVDVDEQWQERSGLVGDHPAVMRSRAWETRTLGWFRVARLEAGERAQVFSALALPRPAWDLPLFGAEVVVISGAVTVVALDWIPLVPDSPYLGALPLIRRQFDHFPAGGDLPSWAATSFSPYALFSRPRGAVSSEEIARAYREYLTSYLALCAGAQPYGDPAHTVNAQRQYCHAHFSNDPGATMLDRVFGHEWAENYAANFLFRIPDDHAA